MVGALRYGQSPLYPGYSPMPDLLASVLSAAELAEKIKRVLAKIKDPETRRMVSDLTLEVSTLKVDLGRYLEENEILRRRLRELENTEADPCPACRKRGWKLKQSIADPTFGELGASRRTYLCTFCGFTESKLVH